MEPQLLKHSSNAVVVHTSKAKHERELQSIVEVPLLY